MPDVVAHDRGEVFPVTSVKCRQYVFMIANRLVPLRCQLARHQFAPFAVFGSQENDRGFLLTVMPRPHQATGAIRECNHKAQILSVSSPGTVDPDFVRSSLVIPTTITLQFQTLRGLGNRCDAACGICGRAVVTKLVRCQGRRDEQMSCAG